MSGDSADTDTYALKSGDLPKISAPQIAYQPPMPRSYRPRIGLIGTGGISDSHLDAYRSAGWDVVAFWNRSQDKARQKAAKFYPTAKVHQDLDDLLTDGSIDVVDITLPTEVRAPVVRAAILAGKHVLSQKPFVSDLSTGEELVRLAEQQGVYLAVNQNGRWAPHMAWIREACRAGIIGDVLSIHAAVHWNHGWTAGTPFDEIEDLILYDFGIHWFDFLASLVGNRAQSVFATAAKARGQANKVPLMAQAQIRLDGGQASLVFDGGVPRGALDTTYVSGTGGSILSQGPDLGAQSVTLTTAKGIARPTLTGTWFNDGFRGAMGELLCAIEDDREPSNSARDNLNSLALAFAAIHSRQSGQETAVGHARNLHAAPA
ncbi:Gfo/Idh/MocA family protein [Ruegeria arenilitoris]|uniref:Gfo/Idh/MocA family protein n=1 Tax=Ruegeria arenilitoris TaxID=1173585 RepID=UPI0014804FF6|nr:Gfo/Idh/MocA family oxidoreductase [Ruegeria arenilitoris]